MLCFTFEIEKMSDEEWGRLPEGVFNEVILNNIHGRKFTYFKSLIKFLTSFPKAKHFS